MRSIEATVNVSSWQRFFCGNLRADNTGILISENVTVLAGIWPDLAARNSLMPYRYSLPCIIEMIPFGDMAWDKLVRLADAPENSLR